MFFDVLVHSEFGEDVFYRNLDIVCEAYGNVGIHSCFPVLPKLVFAEGKKNQMCVFF